ncbi:MAG: bacillithiol biosynthesis deacetylase BshB1 [Ignavibacteria bacterium GWB2_35_6b]|nr:MAG: bacillithiol biosynthesis deacetylase BshB1 [Ignavibacteria bacterium GWB2_35_6b]
MKLDVIAFAAHPDDVELSIGGTIAKFTKAGFKTGIIDLTKGELGTRGNEKIRAIEASTAAKILGVHHRDNLGIPDGKVRFSENYLKRIVTKIRKYQPKIIFAPHFHDRHPDHIGAAELVKNAMFFSGTPKFITKDKGKIQAAFRPNNLFYFMQTYEFDPTFINDISETYETKMKAVRAFTSQFYDPISKEPETLISSKGFIDYLEARSKFYGFQIRKNYGEPFYTEERIEIDLNSLAKK